tara:strand:+ start:567 stop:1184 length:618 start_codon:yes stop_codon:yes gene_type:complete
MKFRIIAKKALGLFTFILGVGLLGIIIYFSFAPKDDVDGPNIFMAIVPLLFVFTGWSWMKYKGRGIDEVTPPNFECPELDESVELAQSNLEEFKRILSDGRHDTYVKFPFKTPNELTEHIWAYAHFHTDGEFNVSIVNDPYDQEADAEGRRNIKERELEDWQYIDKDGTIYGAYSLIALFKNRERNGEYLSPLMKEQKAQLAYSN